MAVFTKTVALEANNKPIWYKRLIAHGFDILLLFLLSYLLYNLAFRTQIGPVQNANRYQIAMMEIEDDAKLQSGMGYKVVVQPGQEGGKLLHYDQVTHEYYIVGTTEYPSTEIQAEYKRIINANPYYKDYTFYYQVNTYAVIITCGIILEFIFLVVVPLCNKKRATIGELMCGLQLISTKREDKAAWYQMVGRFLFVVVFESVAPFLIIGIWIVLAIPVITLIIRQFNKNNRSLCDFISFSRLIESKTFVPNNIETQEVIDAEISKIETNKEEQNSDDNAVK